MNENSTWVSTHLTKEHDCSGFDCGNPHLNTWLFDHAHRAQDSGNARTYVWLAAKQSSVVAYFSIIPTQVLREGYPSSAHRGYSTVPGFLIARLALDKKLHGQAMGSSLLFDAIKRIVAAAELAGGQLIIVDAIDENAERFYARHDFKKVKSTQHRLYITVPTARSTLGLPPHS